MRKGKWRVIWEYRGMGKGNGSGKGRRAQRKKGGWEKGGSDEGAEG